MSATTWMDELLELLFKFPEQGAQADVEGMSTDERKGLFYFLRGINEAKSYEAPGAATTA